MSVREPRADLARHKTPMPEPVRWRKGRCKHCDTWAGVDPLGRCPWCRVFGGNDD